MGGPNGGGLPKWAGQRMAEGVLIAGVSVGGSYGLLDHRVGAVERSLEKLVDAVDLMSRQVVRLEVISQDIDKHSSKAWHEGAGALISSTEVRVNTIEDRVKNIASRVRDIERALPRVSPAE